jgi:hypothetical protein
MMPQDRLSLSITFVIGLVVGSYLYLTGFSTTFKLPEANDAGVYTGFVVNGDSYGECRVERSCLSYQILGNGVYRAIFDTDSRGRNDVTKEGRLPRKIRLNLQSNLTVDELWRISQPQLVSKCLNPDGTNYRFKVTVEEVEYEVDTCTAEIDYESPVWLSLTAVYNYIASRQ